MDGGNREAERASEGKWCKLVGSKHHSFRVLEGGEMGDDRAGEICRGERRTGEKRVCLSALGRFGKVKRME